MNNTFDLTARQHQLGGTLAAWLAGRPGAAERAGVQNAMTFATSSDASSMRELFAPLSNPSGFAVTDTTAMSVSTVYACLSKLSGAILQLPIHQYKLDASGDRQRMEPTPLWWLLNESPDDAWTAAAWKEWIVRSWGLRGDGITEILRGRGAANSATITGFRPHHPDCVHIRRVGNRLAYDIQDPYLAKYYTLDQDDVLHFTGFGFNGLRSQSVVQWAARNSIGNALAAADFMGRTMGEGAMPQIALTFPKTLGADQSKLLRDSFVATYTGTGARKIPLILTEGAAATPLSISPADMELMAARNFEKGEICEAFGVPPILIGNSEKTSSWGTGIEQITIGFVRFTLAPMLARWEEELNRKIFRRAGQFVEFNLDALLRGDSTAEAAAFRAALGGPGSGDGWMSIDEVRKLKNLPALGGDSASPFKAQRNNTAADTGNAPP
jgi:HK97 family phage portal protein